MGYSSKTMKSIREVEDFIKGQKRDARTYRRMREAEQALRNESVPNKSRTKGSSPLTDWTRKTLSECPGGTRGQTSSGLMMSIRKMIDAENTGCRVVSDTTGMRNGKPYAPTTTQWGYRGGE